MNIPLFLKTSWEWLVIVLIVGVIIVRNKVRGYSWKAKDGSKLSLRDFFRRWGKGIEGITNLQQVRSQMLGTWIVISGTLAGLSINLLVRIEYQWQWISIILVGSLIIITINIIGLYQRYRILKRVEDTVKEIQNEQLAEI